MAKQPSFCLKFVVSFPLSKGDFFQIFFVSFGNLNCWSSSLKRNTQYVVLQLLFKFLFLELIAGQLILKFNLIFKIVAALATLRTTLLVYTFKTSMSKSALQRWLNYFQYLLIDSFKSKLHKYDV